VRFLNRTGHKIPPSIQANRALEWRVLQGLRKIYPITHVGYEVVKARGNSSFSPVMVGQPWQMHRLAALLPLESRRGWDQAQWRFTLGLQTPPKKSEPSPASHAVDGVALAASHFLHDVLFAETKGDHGRRWEGACQITEAPFAAIQRLRWFRRALYGQNPVPGGHRERFGGTTTPWGFRQGNDVEAVTAGRIVRGDVSGYTHTDKTRAISVADARRHRIGPFAVSKVRRLARSSRLLVDRMPNARC
jgi:hypothetical protein